MTLWAGRFGVRKQSLRFGFRRSGMAKLGEIINFHHAE